MIFKLKYITFILIISFVDSLLAADCNDWLQHLAQEHHVSIIPKGGVEGPNYKYFDLPNSPYRLALPAKESKEWKIETRKLRNGSTFTVYNPAFGYSGEFDEAGNCLNSTGFAFDQMDRTVPQSLQGKYLTFNYDWKACEVAKKISKKNRLMVDHANADQIVSALKKSSIEDFKILQNQSKTAGTSNLHQISAGSVSTLLATCRRQLDYLDLTVEKPAIKTTPLKSTR